MKQTISFFFCCLISFVALCQTSYYNGFNQGYQRGYCYEDYTCISPIPPIAPVPRIGENSNSYQDGYNRGFEMGREDSRKGNISTNRTSNTVYHAPSIPNYGYDLPYGQLLDALAQRQALYDYNFEYAQSLLDWIGELKSKTNDTEFLKILDKAQNTILSFEGEDLSLLTNDIKSVERELKRAINEYNSRLAEQENPNAFWKAGIEKMNRGEYSNAIKDFMKVANLAPHFSQVYARRGFCYLRQMNWEEAENDFTVYISQGDTTNLLGIYSYRGWARYYQDKYSLAIADFNFILDLGANADAYFGRGTSKAGLSDFYGAILDYDNSTALEPNHSMVYNNRGWAKFELKKYTEALVDVNKSVQLDPTNSIAFDSRAEIKLALKDYKGAIDDCTKAILLDPKLANSYLIRAKSKLNLGNKIGACEDFSKAGELGISEAYEYIKKHCNN